MNCATTVPPPTGQIGLVHLLSATLHILDSGVGNGRVSLSACLGVIASSWLQVLCSNSTAAFSAMLGTKLDQFVKLCKVDLRVRKLITLHFTKLVIAAIQGVGARCPVPLHPIVAATPPATL